MCDHIDPDSGSCHVDTNFEAKAKTEKVYEEILWTVHKYTRVTKWRKMRRYWRAEELRKESQVFLQLCGENSEWPSVCFEVCEDYLRFTSMYYHRRFECEARVCEVCSTSCFSLLRRHSCFSCISYPWLCWWWWNRLKSVCRTLSSIDELWRIYDADSLIWFMYNV